VLVPAPWQPYLIAAYAGFVGEAGEGFIVDTDHWRHFFLLLGRIWGLSAASINLRRHQLQDMLRQDVFQQDVFQQDVFQQDVFQQDVFQQDVFQQDVFQQDVFQQDVAAAGAQAMTPA
jgi:hypothetical protein